MILTLIKEIIIEPILTTALAALTAGAVLTIMVIIPIVFFKGPPWSPFYP